jgi:hypothetical protein
LGPLADGLIDTNGAREGDRGKQRASGARGGTRRTARLGRQAA